MSAPSMVALNFALGCDPETLATSVVDILRRNSVEGFPLRKLADQIEAAFKPPREPGWYQVVFDGLTLAYYWNGAKFMYGPDSVTGLSDRAAERFKNITPLAVVP